MTAVIPRDQLPPPSRADLAALDLDPEHPETVELFTRSMDRPDDFRTRPTMVPCPAKCCRCACCYGLGMVTSEDAAAWREKQAAKADDHEVDGSA